VIVPPGVAHAIRVEGSEDVIMVYGTSTIFHPEFEGRIASEIESAELPESWQKFLGRDDLPQPSRAVRVNRPYLNLNEAELRSGPSRNDGSAATGFDRVGARS
jgi:hypothetical protein